MKRIGIIGFGSRLSDVVVTLSRQEQEFQIAAICDLDHIKVRQRMERKPELFQNCKLYDDADVMLEQENLDGVMIGTRCDTHAEMAIKVIKKSLPLFLEKPVCVTEEQFESLCAVYHAYDPKVIVSFPLRVTNIALRVKELLDSGVIGEVSNIQAFNDVPYGGVYFHDWYRDDRITGGLWLQKATHDLDYLLHLIGKKAESICAMTSKEVFKGDRAVGSQCEDCDIANACPESPANIVKRGDTTHGLQCCFAKDTGNMDCGSAIVRYNGGILSYSQNFFARFSAARRGARFYGYRGTLEFDFYTNRISIYHHLENKIEIYEIPVLQGNHHGGDDTLCSNYLKLLNGENVPSMLYDGLVSAAMCIAATKSSEQNQFVKVNEV